MTMNISKWVSPIKKKCLVCGTEFYDYKTNKYCSIECADVAYRKQTIVRTQKIRKNHPEYYRKGGKYFYPQLRHKYRIKNMEKYLEYQKKYQAEHREKINEQSRIRYRKKCELLKKSKCI